MSKRILREKSVTLERVKELLLERDEEHAPLNYIQRVTLDYAFRFSKEVPKGEPLVDKLTAELSTKEETRRILNREFTNEEEEEIRKVKILTGDDSAAEEKRQEILQNHAREKAIQIVTIKAEEPDDIVLVLGESISEELKKQLYEMVIEHIEENLDAVASKDRKEEATSKDQGEDLEFEGFLDDEED
ncbi:MAG: hypothetical protein ACFFD4_04670 [Candidatus Odinarchaeota archaeon]